MWVESTSPGYVSDDDPKQVPVGESDESAPVPEVKVSACSEKSVSASPPGNTTTSTTGVDEDLPTFKQKMVMDRMDSITTSEKSEANSFVSSEVDKVSLVKMRFNCNLHRAREDAKKEVDLENFDRFWRHLYNKSETKEESTKKAGDEERADRKTTRRRGRTPTPSIERVVLYYTTDRRISLTPSASSLSPSPEPTSQRSFAADSGRHLFIQSNKPRVPSQDSLSSEPIGDVVVPIVSQKPPVPPLPQESSSGSEPALEGEAPVVVEKNSVSQQDSTLSKLVNRPPSGSERRQKEQQAFERGIVIFESEETTPSSEEAAVNEAKGKSESSASVEHKEDVLVSPVEDNVFFQLDEFSGSEPEEGRVDISHVYGRHYNIETLKNLHSNR
ncbi:hypothetical protein COOONC_09137 [Cooperia oncophora]